MADQEEKSPISQPGEPEHKNIEDVWSNLFTTSVSGTGEEELLRIASDFTLQLSAGQIRAILWLEVKALQIEAKNPKTAEIIRHFTRRWLELKKNNSSDMFVMRALDSISLRKFIGENAFKIDIQK